MDDILLNSVSRNLMKLKINHIEDSVMILSVEGRDTPNDIESSMKTLNQYVNNLNDSNLFLEKLIDSKN